MMEPWLVIQVKPVSEFEFKQWGEKRNCQVYVPISKYWMRPRHKKSHIQVSRPVFAGYVFVRDVGEALGIVREAPMFQHVLRTQEALCHISDEEIEKIKVRELVGEFDLQRRNMTRPRVGARVRITQGVFEGVQGHVGGTLRKDTFCLDTHAGVVTLPLVVEGAPCYEIV